jgi:hypothetical protein
MVHQYSQKSLKYDFKLEKGKAKLEVTKPDPKSEKATANPTQIQPPSNTPNLPAGQNPLIAPFIELGFAFREFTKALNKKHKKKKRKLKLKKTKKKHKKGRKAFMDAMGGLGGVAAIGGAAAVGGMAMKGSADNEELEKKISIKENELGIMHIRTSVDNDTNQWLFTSSEKIKGLTLKAKALLLNGEVRLNQMYEQVDNIMGDFQAIDENYDRHMYGGAGDDD